MGSNTFATCMEELSHFLKRKILAILSSSFGSRCSIGLCQKGKDLETSDSTMKLRECNVPFDLAKKLLRSLFS